jgi:hypothetical protein
MADRFARLGVQRSAPTVMSYRPLSVSPSVGRRARFPADPRRGPSLLMCNREIPNGSMMFPASNLQFAEMGREANLRVCSVSALLIGAAAMLPTGSQSFGRRP